MDTTDDQRRMFYAASGRPARVWEALCELIDSPANPLSIEDFDRLCATRRPDLAPYRPSVLHRIAKRKA
jgi:hypothetical protein